MLHVIGYAQYITVITLNNLTAAVMYIILSTHHTESMTVIGTAALPAPRHMPDMQ